MRSFIAPGFVGVNQYLRTCKSQAVNVLSPALIAHLGLKYKFRFCYISSDDVFDGHLGRPYHEFDNTNPLNRYAKKKGWQNKIFREESDAVIARLPMVYGGTYHRSHKSSFLTNLLMRQEVHKGNGRLATAVSLTQAH